MNPLEVIYSWQSVLVAATSVALTELLKTVLDVWWGHVDPTPTPKVKDMYRVGAQNRRSSLVLDKFIVPAAPVLVGIAYALLVPARPDVIDEYLRKAVRMHALAEQDWRIFLIYAAWGAACGQFSGYIYTHVKAALGGVIDRVLAGARVAVAPASPPAPSAPPSVPSHANDDHDNRDDHAEGP